MTETRDDTPDIAWMRQLAEEGATAPMGGGSIMMAAGLIFGIASLAHWAVAAQLIQADPNAFAFIWLGATGLFLATLTVLVTLRAKAIGVKTTVDRATRAAWSAVGWGIFALFGSIALIGLRVGQQSLLLLALVPSIVMVFYGLGWAVSAAMTRMKLMSILAVLSFLAAPLLALLAGQATLYLAYAAALFALMAVPGFLLMRAANRG